MGVRDVDFCQTSLLEANKCTRVIEWKAHLFCMLYQIFLKAHLFWMLYQSPHVLDVVSNQEDGLKVCQAAVPHVERRNVHEK